MGSGNDNKSRKLVWILETSEFPEERKGPCRGRGVRWPPVSCRGSFCPMGWPLPKGGWQVCPFRACLDHTSSAFTTNPERPSGVHWLCGHSSLLLLGSRGLTLCHGGTGPPHPAFCVVRKLSQLSALWARRVLAPCRRGQYCQQSSASLEIEALSGVYSTKSSTS